MLVIMNFPALRAGGQLDFAGLQGGAQGLAEHRQHERRKTVRAIAAPFQIKPGSAERCRPQLQNLTPIGVGPVGGHVVGNNVKDQTETQRGQSMGQTLPFIGAAQLRIDGLRIGDIVAMLTAGPGGEHGRGIEMRYAQALKITGLTARRSEAPGGLELEPVGGGQAIR